MWDWSCFDVCSFKCKSNIYSAHILAHPAKLYTHTHTQTNKERPLFELAYVCVCVCVCVLANKTKIIVNSISLLNVLVRSFVCLSIISTQPNSRIPLVKPLDQYCSICDGVSVCTQCVRFRCIFKQMRLMFIFHFNQTHGYWYWHRLSALHRCACGRRCVRKSLCLQRLLMRIYVPHNIYFHARTHKRTLPDAHLL